MKKILIIILAFFALFISVLSGEHTYGRDYESEMRLLMKEKI